MNVDVVVIGSGAAGLTAAVTAAKSGLKVLVLESTPFFGGTTAFSGGGIWIPLNHHQSKLGLEDSREDALLYLKSILGDLFEPEKVEAYVDTGPEMLRFIEDNTEVKYLGFPGMDNYPKQPGAKLGRTLTPLDFDGRKLGRDLSLVRPALRELGLFHSMQFNVFNVYRLRRFYASWSDMLWAVKSFASYVWDRVLRGRGTVLANGNGLAGALLKSAKDSGVTLLNNAPARSLIQENGRVKGVVFEHNGKTERVMATRGVVLATGGFGADEEMRRKYQPQAAHGWSLQPEGSRGDGIKMGISAGGSLNEENATNGIWMPASEGTRKDGTRAIFPSFVFDRHCPGSIIVDARTGKRFVDEGFHYQEFGQTAYRKGVTSMWLISDSKAVAKYGIGMAKPWPFKPGPWVKRKYLAKAPTIAALAEKIGLDSATLEKTVADFNKYADEGVDPDFHRGEDPYSAMMGDALHKPNPSMGALRTPPFYAVEMRMSSLSTLAGLNTNANAQVLDQDGKPIAGLYAAGLDNNTVMRGLYPGGGAAIGPCMVFGYRAARHLAKSSDSRLAFEDAAKGNAGPSDSEGCRVEVGIVAHQR